MASIEGSTFNISTVYKCQYGIISIIIVNHMNLGNNCMSYVLEGI